MTHGTNKVVDIYMPLDSRDAPNAEVWPLAARQLEELVKVIRGFGWEPNVLNPDRFVSSVSQGIGVVAGARGSRLIDFMAGWSYPDFSVSPLWQVAPDIPKLMLGSSIPEYPGNVGLLATAAGTAHVGLETSRFFVEDFADHHSYAGAIESFLKHGAVNVPHPKPLDVISSEEDQRKAKTAVISLKGMIYGAVGPRSMQMWNKISEADFLRYFGIAREGFDGLRLLKMIEKIPDERAERALDFLLEKGMDIRLGPDPARHLTRSMVLFQMKAYFALVELKEQFGLDFIGVQDQLDWVEHLPTTDLTLGLLNNRLRPEGDGQTIVASTEADDGAAVTMQLLKLLADGDPVGFNDFRYWDGRGMYWFVNSGALAPFFASGRHDSLAGAWSERQTDIYFREGGGTCSVVVRVPGVVTWARFSFRNHKLYLAGGRGLTDVPSQEQWTERSRRCNPEWPHWYLRLCGKPEWFLNSNHPITVLGDHLGELRAVALELGLPFECYDYLTPEQVQKGEAL
jgi:L-fucose isomerase-like protein